MSRLVVVESLRSRVAVRHEWDVVMDSAHPERGLDPAVLLEKVGAVAASLAREVAGQDVIASSLDKLEVLATVHGGERLIVTAAVEPSRDGAVPISLVARRRRGAPGAVVLAGVLRFVTEQPTALVDSQHERLVRGGAAPMVTSFRAQVGSDVLLAGNVVPWVHASSLVSAQGFAGGAVTLAEVQSLSVLRAVAANESLALQCSVVRSSGSKVTVLALVRGEVDRRDVLAAVMTFSVRQAEAPLLVVG